MAVAADIDAERELAACLIADGTLCAEALSLPEDAITTPALSLIVRAAIAQFAGGEIPDAVTVAAALDSAGRLQAAGGTAAIIGVANDVLTTTPGYVAHLVERVRSKWAMRLLTTYAQDFVRLAGDLRDPSGTRERTAADVLAEAASVLDRARAAVDDGRSVQRVEAALQELWADIEARSQKPDSALAVMTGIRSIDRTLAGVGPGQLLTVAARPGMGKTLFGLWWAVEAAKRGIPGYYASLEMTCLEIAARIVSQFSLLPTDKLLGAEPMLQADWTPLSKGLGIAGNLPLVVSDNEASVGQLRADICRARTLLGGLRLVVVDQLELIDMSADRERGQREDVAWGRTVNRLKKLAKAEGVGILLLHQLRREAEERPKHVPQLRDLADTSVVEKRSDKVVFLVQPAAYTDTARVNKADPDYNEHDLDIYVAKHRNGPKGYTTVFVDLERNKLYPRENQRPAGER